MEGESNPTVIELRGNIGIGAMRELADAFRDALARPGDVHVAFADVEDLELPGVQLVYAVALEAARAGRRMVFSGTINQKISGKLFCAGFIPAPVDDATGLETRLVGFPRPEGAG